MQYSRREFIFRSASSLIDTAFQRNRFEMLISQGEEALRSRDPEKFLESPYLTSLLCYSSRYIEQLARLRDTRTSNEKILQRLARDVSTRTKTEFFYYHIGQIQKNIPERELSRWSKPLISFSYGKGYNHPNALDLFTTEESPVFSVLAGKVLLAENNWEPTDMLSSSSYKGGNTVVTLSPQGLITRSAHLSSTSVKTGQYIPSAFRIGEVGHTGQNASKKGHGNHLHIEIKEVDIPEIKTYHCLQDE